MLRPLFLSLTLLGCGAAAGVARPSASPSAGPSIAVVEPEAVERDSERGAPSDPSSTTPGPCVLSRGAARELRPGARHPRVVLGAGGAIVVTGGDDHLFVRVPLETGPIDLSLSRRALEEGREWIEGPFLGRVSGEAAMVTCLNDDFCAERLVTDGGGCDAFTCALVVPASPSPELPFALPHQALGVGPSFGFDGDAVFGAAAAYRGGGMSSLFGFVLSGGRARRVLLHSFGSSDDALGNQLETAIRIEGGEAIVSWWLGESSTEHRVRLTRDGRREDAPTRPTSEAATPRPILEARTSPETLPFLARAEGDAMVAIPELASASGRFAPSVAALGHERVLVFSEGLGESTRIRALIVDDAGRPIGPALEISAAGTEAGRAAIDALEGTAFVVWEEHHPAGWAIYGAPLSCSR